MLNKETLKLGKSFERLLANVDYQELQKFITSQIQTISTQLLQPKPAGKTIEEWAMDAANLQGQLLSLAIPDSHMESVVKQMYKLQEQKEKEEKKLE